MGRKKKRAIPKTISWERVGVIFSGSSEVHLKNGDVKYVCDVVPGDELLGFNEAYHPVTCVYRPRLYHFGTVAYGIGCGSYRRGQWFRGTLEVSGESLVGHRNMKPLRDIRWSPKVAKTVNLVEDCLEWCQIGSDCTEYWPEEILKVWQSKVTPRQAYCIGIEGGWLVVNHFLLGGCEPDRIEHIRDLEGLILEARTGSTGRDTDDDV